MHNVIIPARLREFVNGACDIKMIPDQWPLPLRGVLSLPGLGFSCGWKVD
jgi:hypothetical protein